MNSEVRNNYIAKASQNRFKIAMQNNIHKNIEPVFSRYIPINKGPANIVKPQPKEGKVKK